MALDPPSVLRLQDKKMSPTLVRRVTAALTQLDGEGISVRVAVGFRDGAAQNALSHSVTNASAYRSWHQGGVAVDCCPVALITDWLAGKPVQTDKRFQRMVEVMKAHQLDWGGDWHSIHDYPHFQCNELPASPTHDDSVLMAAENLQQLWVRYNVAT